MEWLSDLHDNLLGGKTGPLRERHGRDFYTVLALTGAIIWWPGIKNWRRGSDDQVGRQASRDGITTCIAPWGSGFCSFVLMWGVTGIYLSFEGPCLRAVQLAGPQ